jgi:hypothetical protein
MARGARGGGVIGGEHRGVPERVSMKVTGHKSRVSPADLQDVARRLTGTFPGTLVP